MMRLKNISLTLLLLLAFTALSCGGGGGDDTPLTPEEQRLVDLAGNGGTTWTATSITFEGAPATGFDNFSLTLRGDASSKTYTAVDGDPVFGNSGTWDFNGTNINQVVIDGNSNNIFTISNLNTTATPNTVRISVNFTASGGAAAGTNGLYVFNLQEQ